MSETAQADQRKVVHFWYKCRFCGHEFTNVSTPYANYQPKHDAAMQGSHYSKSLHPCTPDFIGAADFVAISFDKDTPP